MRASSRHPLLLLSPLSLLILLLSGCTHESFYADTPIQDPAIYRQLQEAPGTVDSVTVKAGSHYAHGSFYNALWGARHRAAWNTSVTVPVLRMDTVKGGLTVEKIGGGMQTISATLVGGDGMTYALRSVDKRPEVKLPPLLRSTFLGDLVRDQTSALNPYAALVVAPLAAAAGIPHATPTLVYVRPEEEALGKYKELLSDRLYFLEEKFNDRRAIVGNLEHASNIVDTDEMLRSRYGQPHHDINQVAFAKARLLDILIGDRDRHEDQWEWAVYKMGEEVRYNPIPKDRDNAFFHYDDGVLSWLLSRKWAQRKFVSFHGDYRDVKALAIKAEYIDARALPQVTAQQFDSLAHELQRAITDPVIEQAVRQLPDNVYELQGESLAQQLKSRRDGLDQAAREFYKTLAENVLVIGTDAAELFEVTRRNDEETEVRVRSKSDGHIVYHRVFFTSETDEVTLQGLGGHDTFEVRGQVRKGITLVLDGGEGQDSITDKSHVGGWRDKTVVQAVELKQ